MDAADFDDATRARIAPTSPLGQSPDPCECERLAGVVRHVFTHFPLDYRSMSPSRSTDDSAARRALGCAWPRLAREALPSVMRKSWRTRCAKGPGRASMQRIGRACRSIGAHLRPHARAQRVDDGRALRRLDVPEGPAVAGLETLRQRADPVDRADRFAERERAVGAHQRLMPALGIDELCAGRDQPALDQRRERHARRLARGHERRERRLGQRLDRGDALLGRRGVGGVALDADEAPAEPLRHRAGRAGAEERVEHHIAGREAASMTRASSASGFCVGCSFLPSPPLSRSSPVQSGNSQSERICMSSLPAFSAS